MNKDRTTISGIVDRLEKEGLVARSRNPEDRRTHLIYLTPRAFDLKDELEWLATQANTEATAMLTKTEKEQLEKILIKILEAAAAARGYG
jgi:DNA-binding MarR family transcriptional regulator